MIAKLLPCLACAGLAFASPAHDGAWVTEIAYQASDKLGACVVGDVDPAHPGNEIVTVCRSGQVFVLVRENDGWSPRIIGKTPGEMIQVAVGDILPEHPGAEIAVVGASQGHELDDRPGKAWVFHRSGNGWRSQAAFTSAKLLHAVTVRDGQLLVGGYDLDLRALEPAAGAWRDRFIGGLPGAAKCATSLADGRSFVACRDGSVMSLDSAGTLALVHRRQSGRARLDAEGEQLVVCDDDGTLSLLTTDGEGEVIYREGDKLRGAVLADLDPTTPGVEIATVGYERRLTVLTKRDGEWVATPVLRETKKFHGLATGDLDGDGDHELVACGYAGRLIIVDHFTR